MPTSPPFPFPPPTSPQLPIAKPPLPPRWPAVGTAVQPACAVVDGSSGVAADLRAAESACRTARSHVAAANPRVWAGPAATRFSARREDDLVRVDRVLDAIAAAQSALAAHAAARRELAAALAGAPGAPPGPGLVGTGGAPGGALGVGPSALPAGAPF